MRNRMFGAVCGLLLFVGTAFGGSPLLAQGGTAILDGRVSVEGGRPLAGAAISIVGSSVSRSLAGADGSFRLTGLPAGSTTIEVTLIGFQTQRQTVQLQAGSVTPIEIVLVVSPLALEGILVEGQVGQAEALNRQRTASSIRSIVSSEQIERFPDAQVPDALRRLPGVSARPDRGETGFIFIRGLSPDLTTVTVDGARLPSTAQTGRGVELSSIPTELLASVEVIKAITPNMDADAVAGSINLEARRPTARQVDGRIEGGSHSLSGGSTYRGGITFSDAIGPWSFVVGADYASQVRSTENLQYTFGTYQNQTVMTRLLLQQYPIERSRYSVNGALNYALSSESELFLRGFYSRYDTEEERHRLLYRLDQGTRISPIQANNARTYRQARRYKWEREIWDLTAGGRHELLGDLGVDYYVSTSLARRTEPYREYFFFRQTGVDILLDPTSNPRFPELRVTNSKNVNNLADFSLQEYEWRLDHNEDNDLGGALNFTLPITLAESTGLLQWGGRVSSRQKERDTSEAVLNQIQGSFNMEAFGTSSPARDITPEGYPMGPILDWDKGEAFYEANRDRFAGNPNAAAIAANTLDFEASEVISAGYLMATLELGDLQVIGGGRYEHTSIDYDGKRLVFNSVGQFQQVLPTTATSSYGSFFPALHLRFRVDEGTNIRLAATRTIARPNFLDLAPNEFVRPDELTIRRGNPELSPGTSANLDLLFERYLSSVGMIQAGLFYKSIQDFAYTSRELLTSGSLAGYELLIPRNGAEATVRGLELAWQQRMAFLPGALNGLGVYMNYTYVDTETDFGVAGGRKLRLPEQFNHVANLALTYDLGGFNGLVSANHQGNFIDQVGSSEANDRYGRHRTQVDASFSQEITGNIRAYVQLNNITNAPYVKYVGTMATPHENEFEGFWGSAGLRFNLR